MAGEEAERFDDYQDQRVRAAPLSHVWLPTGDVIVGCTGGQLLRVSQIFSNLETLEILSLSISLRPSLALSVWPPLVSILNRTPCSP